MIKPTDYELSEHLSKLLSIIDVLIMIGRLDVPEDSETAGYIIDARNALNTIRAN